MATEKSEEKVELPSFKIGRKTYKAKAMPAEVLGFGFMRRVRKMSELEAIFEVVEALFDEDALEALDALSTAEAFEVLEQVFEQAGINAGE